MNDVEQPKFPMAFFMSPTLTKFAPAFVKAQKAMGAAIKGSTNPFYKSKYPDMGSVVEAVKDPLNDNDIGYLQPILSSDGGKGVNVLTLLLHSSGEYIGGVCEFPIVKSDPQEMGKAVAYDRRYSLQSIAGIPAEDDDGNSAAGKKEEKSKALVAQTSFPPGELLSGVFLGILPRNGTTPPMAHIQTLDGATTFEIYGDPEPYRSLIGREVEYQWEKKGPRCVLKEMYLKPMPKAEVEVQAPAEKPAPAKPKPPIEEKDPHLRALVLSVEAVAKPGKKPYTKFELGFPDGSSKFAEYWGSEANIDSSLTDFKDLEGSDVFFHMDSREFKGKNYYTIHDVFMADAYEEAMAARAAQEEANV